LLYVSRLRMRWMIANLFFVADGFRRGRKVIGAVADAGEGRV
jgi:hypothetical protein